jgi:hypothetical protein
MKMRLKICCTLVLVLALVYAVIRYDAYLQSVVGSVSTSIRVDNHDATHYTMRYTKFNRVYHQLNLSRISKYYTIPLHYNLTRFEVNNCPFILEVQYNLYAEVNDTFHLLEANVTHFHEVIWSGKPKLHPAHLIGAILAFFIAPGLLIAFAISKFIGRIQQHRYAHMHFSC